VNRLITAKIINKSNRGHHYLSCRPPTPHTHRSIYNIQQHKHNITITIIVPSKHPRSRIVIK